MKKIACVLFLFSVVSCVTPNYVTNITSYEKVQHLNKKSVTVVGLDRVFVHNYEKTLYKNYNSDVDFVATIAKQFASSLNGATFHKAIYDFSSDWNHINTMASKKSYLKVQELLKECTTDYVIILDEFELKKIINNTTTYTGAGDFNNGQYNTTTEMIHLSAKVKMFDVKTHDPIIDFDVYGEDQVVLFSYSNSLDDAKDKMIGHSIEFLASHKK